MLVFKVFLLGLILSMAIFVTVENANSAFAITSKDNNKLLWTDIKEIDLNTGKVVKTLFEAGKTAFTIIADNKNTANSTASSLGAVDFNLSACAYDAVHNRLYFSPLNFSDIIYLDLNKTTAYFVVVKSKIIESKTIIQPEANQITRMVIAADGNGYALSNDANHLIKFSTENAATVTDLGVLNNAAVNKNISVHDKLTGWGGDLVADASGNLLLVAAKHTVYTIDIAKKTASLTGLITGLPANFTTNGVAVNKDGALIVTSARVADFLYIINAKTLAATKMNSIEKNFIASDLANGNLMGQKTAVQASHSDDLEMIEINTPFTTPTRKIFPNPANPGAEVKVSIDGQLTGNYTIVVSDLNARTIQTSSVNMQGTHQLSGFRLSSQQAKGIYVVNVYNNKLQNILKEKLLVN